MPVHRKLSPEAAAEIHRLEHRIANAESGHGGRLAAIEESIETIQAALDNLEALDDVTIRIYSGAVDDIPDGWQLADGTNGTLDLRNSFIIGAGDEYDVGDTGGEEEHTLTTDEMPEHTHGYDDYAAKWTDPASGEVAYSGTSERYDTYVKTDRTADSAGGGSAHNNMPPYYALCFIQKVALSGSGTGGQVDHGELSGLADDDHPHYHTNARGDARYWVKGNEIEFEGGNGHSCKLEFDTTTGTFKLWVDGNIKISQGP